MHQDDVRLVVVNPDGSGDFTTLIVFKEQGNDGQISEWVEDSRRLDNGPLVRFFNEGMQKEMVCRISTRLSQDASLSIASAIEQSRLHSLPATSRTFCFIRPKDRLLHGPSIGGQLFSYFVTGKTFKWSVISGELGEFGDMKNVPCVLGAVGGISEKLAMAKSCGVTLIVSSTCGQSNEKGIWTIADVYFFMAQPIEVMKAVERPFVILADTAQDSVVIQTWYEEAAQHLRTRREERTVEEGIEPKRKQTKVEIVMPMVQPREKRRREYSEETEYPTPWSGTQEYVAQNWF